MADEQDAGFESQDPFIDVMKEFEQRNISESNTYDCAAFHRFEDSIGCLTATLDVPKDDGAPTLVVTRMADSGRIAGSTGVVIRQVRSFIWRELYDRGVKLNRLVSLMGFTNEKPLHTSTVVLHTLLEG